jgi:glycyl-tRNA synthetase
MDTLISLCKRRGFIYPGSSIYGGLANSWDYGPLGAQLKKNIKDHWWQTFVESRSDMVGLDGAIIMNPRVWEASGHVAGFTDPLVEDTVTKKRYRADQLLEAAVDGLHADGKSIEEINALLKEHTIQSPDGNPLGEARTFNLLFETKLGVVEGDKDVAYLRPETAQAIFVNFKNVLDTTRVKIPFGIAQIGKAFRNEITPGNFTYRTLEFEQMEIEYFVPASEWEQHFESFATAMEEWAAAIGVDTSKLHRLEVEGDGLAHYSKRTIDFEFDYPFGTKELWGLAYRTDYDLTKHMEHSGEKMLYTDPQDPKNKYIPHVVEPSMGVDRTMLALLLSAYAEEEVEGETRVVMRFTGEMAPYQVAVLPLMKKEPLGPKAEELYELLRTSFRTEYDDSGSIGKRYRRQDEIGTPFCITVDYDTIEDNTVTIRHRDSMEQERVAIDELVPYIQKQILSYE